MKDVLLSVLAGIGIAVGLVIAYVALQAVNTHWAIIKLPF